MSKLNKVIFGVFLAFSFILIIVLGIKKANDKDKVIDSIVENVLESEGATMLYVGSTECKACKLQASQMSLLLNDYDFDYFYIDIDEISTASKRDKIFNKLEMDVTNGVTTPTILVYKDGELIDQLSSLNCANKIFNTLRNNGIISQEKKLPINYLGYSSFNDLIDKNEKTAVILGAVSSEDSNTADEIFWNIAKTYDADLNYLMLDDLSEQELSSFQSQFSYFADNDLYVPSILIIENKQVVNIISNLQDESKYVAFLTENGIIK